MKKIKNAFLILRGRFRITFGFCPQCNSDAPELYDCNVCRWNKVEKKYWWAWYKHENNLY